MSQLTEKQKMISGVFYDPQDPQLVQDRVRARQIIRHFNDLEPEKVQERKSLLKSLLGKTGKDFYIEPPLRVDYGYNVALGEGVYINFGCVILDCAPVEIGDNVMFGPNVQLYPATHPTDAKLRISGKEYALPIKIGNNVWIGGGVIILPGVSIGDNTTIGAGSVVTKDIPDNVVAVGNPCKVIKKLVPENHKNPRE
eukprot:TRINITY_DN1385_c0_g1_i1.p1 TRINITY_DN1385_c0_g1~~TRINITY_DN1385_c0_g1_i1.p1  ORF type:complete len:197 (-),score=41.35 TRINITY_DN1385_c0_g1_i1:139-729(-)